MNWYLYGYGLGFLSGASIFALLVAIRREHQPREDKPC
jgi:hypothetical protein